MKERFCGGRRGMRAIKSRNSYIEFLMNIGILQRSGKTRDGRNPIKMKLILSVKM